MLGRAMPKILPLPLRAATGLLAWRHEGRGWLTGWPDMARGAAAALPALPVLRADGAARAPRSAT